MRPLVVLANSSPSVSTCPHRPKGREHVCYACEKRYDELIAQEKIEKFPCKCKLSSDIQLSELRTVSQDLTPDERVYLEYAVDAVSWAEFELNWFARYYQEEILRCSAQKKVIHAGRRVGKSTALAVDALHKACTNSNFRVLIVAPYQDQVDLLFEQLDKHIENSLTLKSAAIRRAKNPSQVIEFANGSTIKGSTAGVKTGARANKIRGQDAHAIYLDETDMLAQEDLESILAILASHKDCYLWASGTPSGKREHFYRWVHDKSLGLKEFHFRSSESPEWTPETEAWLRSTYSAVAYAQEFDAEFGAEARGVFPKELVEEQVRKYDLEMRNPQPGFFYGMGVDWNDTTEGVHINITSYNKVDGRYWVEKKIVVSKLEFTQSKAVERIIELNAVWDPIFIYVDAGFGQTQVEMLRQYGLANPKSGILRKLKAVQMGSKVTIQDPFLGAVEKDVKPLMVNFAVQRVEQDRCVFPKSEFKGEGSEGLVDQMLKFRIKRFSPDGRPVYDSTPDHALTAWMLAIYGFWMEHSDIGKGRPARRIALVHTGEAKAPEKDLPPGMGFVKFEIPVERVREKEAEKKRTTLPLKRTMISPSRGSRTVGEVLSMREEREKQEARIKAAGRIGFYSHLRKPPPKRKSF